MHSHQGKYILYYINHQSINPLKSINQTIGINDNMIQQIIVSTKEGLEIWETKDNLEPKGPPGEDHASCTTIVVGHKCVM